MLEYMRWNEYRDMYKYGTIADWILQKFIL